MTVQHALRFSLVVLVGIGASLPRPVSAQVTRTTYPAAERRDTARVVSAGPFVFPSGASGTTGDAVAQVDEVLERVHRDLGTIGLGIGNMVQHTIYVRDGVNTGAVLNRFHATATRLAPSLKTQKSVGTILRLPSFPDPKTLVAVDLVAANPGQGKPDTFSRVPFKFGPQEIAESYRVDGLVFGAGTEAMDFQYGRLPSGIDAQIEAIVGKLKVMAANVGLSLGSMVAHNLYVKNGTDPKHVIAKFHELVRAAAPELKDRPSVGTLAVVDGMAGDGFLLEMDAIFDANGKPGRADTFRRVPFTPAIDISRSVDVGPLVLLAGFDGVSVPTPSDDAVVQAGVAAREIHSTLQKSGLSIADVVKVKLYIRKDADVEQVRRAFHEAAAKLDARAARNPFAETVIVVERLDSATAKVEASATAARAR